MRSYVVVHGVRVDHKIFSTKFCCDYEKCKGACCHQPLLGVSLLGGKLLDNEAAEILYHRKLLAPLCQEEDRKIVTEHPVDKEDSLFFTPLNAGRCVFCNLQKGTCVLKGVKADNTDIDIPIHCSLYPIVWETSPVESLEIGNIYDEYCIYGYEKGARENVYLLDFAKIPLVKNFGTKFYAELKRLQKNYI